MRALEKSELMKKKSVFEIFVANIIKRRKYLCWRNLIIKTVRCRESLMFRSPIPVLIHKIKELNRLNLYVDSGNIIITSYLKSTIYQSDNIAVKDNL